MEEIRAIIHRDRLRQRQQKVEATLRHLESERREVEENSAWMNPAAYELRVSLLNRLTGWYRNEKQQIENTLGGAGVGNYGLCSVCHEPIEAELLEIFPEAEFCLDCQEYRERLRAG
jgi:RNA polymerase-binding transcription factor DksA